MTGVQTCALPICGWQTVSSGGTTASQLSAYGTEIVLQSAANLNACYTISGNYAASAEL